MPPGPEPDPNPHPGLRIGVKLLGHRVVEVPVKMQHPLVDKHPRHGQLLGQRGPRHVRGLAFGPFACRTLSRISASCSGGAPSAPPSRSPSALLTLAFLPNPTDNDRSPPPAHDLLLPAEDLNDQMFSEGHVRVRVTVPEPPPASEAANPSMNVDSSRSARGIRSSWRPAARRAP